MLLEDHVFANAPLNESLYTMTTSSLGSGLAIAQQFALTPSS